MATYARHGILPFHTNQGESRRTAVPAIRLKLSYQRMTPCEPNGLTPKTENPVGDSQSQPGSFLLRDESM
jgi:hypothetical protein